MLGVSALTLSACVVLCVVRDAVTVPAVCVGEDVEIHTRASVASLVFHRMTTLFGDGFAERFVITGAVVSVVLPPVHTPSESPCARCARAALEEMLRVIGAIPDL